MPSPATSSSSPSSLAKKRSATTLSAAADPHTSSVGAESTQPHAESRKRTVHQSSAANDDDDEINDMGEFEDAFEDDEEDDDDEEVVIDGEDDDDAMEDDVEQPMDIDGSRPLGNDVRDVPDEDDEKEEDVQVYLPGQKLEEGEVLVHDSSAYEMLHQIQVEWPCLSFDILRDNLGSGRVQFPLTTYIVAGSQAETAKDNKIYLMKMTDLHRTKHDDDDEEDDEDNDLDEEPVLDFRTIPHNGGINRIRAMPHPESHIVAAWSEKGTVGIWDCTAHVTALDSPGFSAPKDVKPIFTVKNHRSEGFAMDWASDRKLLTGDFTGSIFLTLPNNSSFETKPSALKSHKKAVEDLQWAPKEATVFASCSSDKTVKIWDTRVNTPQISFTAHDCDVNVISWNRLDDKLIASGCDSGAFSIWDLRNVVTSHKSNATPTPAATFSWHRDQITSLEWHPFESTVLVVAGADNQVTLWDFGLERDEEEERTIPDPRGGGGVIEVPEQLLFVHQGQEELKEVHFHRQIPGLIVSTALSGFNIFKTINS